MTQMTPLDFEMMALDRPGNGSQALVAEQEGLWVKTPPVVENDKVVVGGMWPHQKAWWELPNFIKVLVGGYGAGKTMIGSKRLLALAFENAPVPVASVSPTYGMARTTVIATISELLRGKKSLLGRKLAWKWNGQNKEFSIRAFGRDATITCYSGENPELLKGPNLAAAWIDEPFLQDSQVFLQMLARIRHPAAKVLELSLTGTPEQLNWGYDLCVGKMKDQQDVGVVFASTANNLALPKAYVQRLIAAFDEKTQQAYLHGKFVNLASGMVFHRFDQTVHVQQLETYNPDGTVKIPDGVELGVGMDFNVNPMSAAVFWRAGGHLHYFDELELPNSDTEFMCSTLTERYGKRLETVYPDCTGNARKSAAPGGKTDFWYIRQAGYQITAPYESPKRKDSFNAVNARLMPGKGQAPLVTVSPRCTSLIKYLSTYSYELMNKQEEMSHLIDAFRYPITYLFPVDRDSLVGQHKLIGF